MIDRFGPLPDEVENLLKIVAIKRLCRAAGVEKLDAGPKGAVVEFHNETFANPAGLVELISRRKGEYSLRPDHRLVCRRDWSNPAQRLKGAHELMRTLAEVVA
jgi:transcription-repair coupling factor (superfamily II helicase)